MDDLSLLKIIFKGLVADLPEEDLNNYRLREKEVQKFLKETQTEDNRLIDGFIFMLLALDIMDEV